MKLYHFIFLIFLLFNSQISPIVSYYLLKQDEKYILILGDYHHVAYTQMNSYHTKYFAEICDRYQLEKKIPCIIECGFNSSNIKIEPSVSEKIKENRERDITIRSLHEYFSKNNKLFASIFYDARGYQTCIIPFFLGDLEAFLSNKSLTDQFNFNEFKAKINYNNNIRISEYLHYLMQSEFNIKEALPLYENLNLLHQELNNLYTNYLANVTEIMKELTYKYKVNRSIKLIDFLIDLFQECKTIEEAYERSTIINLMFQTDICYSDIGFLTQLHIQQCSHQKTLLIVGDFHAYNISTTMQRIGYELVNFDTIRINDKITEKKEFLPNLLNLLILFLSVSNTDNKLIDSNKEYFFCNNKTCSKQCIKDHTLILCSGCSYIPYCNLNCFKEDWEFHKNFCKKLKQL